MSNYGPKMQQLLNEYITSEFARMDKTERYRILYGSDGEYLETVERANTKMLWHMTELRSAYDSPVKHSSEEEVAEYILQALERHDGEHS